jgi:hypothetical protein
MHSFEGLADEISALLKNVGDIGDTGDRQKISSSINDIDVTKIHADVSPSKAALVTPPANFGDAKGLEFQRLERGVTNVTSVTKKSSNEDHRSDFEERAAIIQYDGGYSRAAAEHLARLIISGADRVRIDLAVAAIDRSEVI